MYCYAKENFFELWGMNFIQIFLRYNMCTNTDELKTLTLIANQHLDKLLSLY